MMFIYLLLLTTYQLAAAEIAPEIPEANCDVKKPNFDACLDKFLRRIFPTLTSDGIPELQILPLDPLEIPVMPIILKADLFKGYLNMTNMVIKGLANLKFKKFSVKELQPHKYKAEVKATIPKLFVTGDFDADMTVTQVNVSGNGNYALKLRNLDVTVVTHEELYNKGRDDPFGTFNGINDYFKISKVSIKTNVGGFKLNATLEKNPKLAQLGANMINMFWPAVFKQAYPFFAPHIEQIVQDHLNKYFDKMPIYRRLLY